jgi:hypothetical protein
MQELRDRPKSQGFRAGKRFPAAFNPREMALVPLESILYYPAIFRGGAGQQDSVKTYMVNL